MIYTYTIEVEDEDAIEKIKSIAAENGISLSVKEDDGTLNAGKSGERLAAALNEIAKHGGLKSFGDASEWQKGQRKERSLTGRD